MKKIESFMKKYVWATVAVAFILGAGGLMSAWSQTKNYTNKVKSTAGVQ